MKPFSLPVIALFPIFVFPPSYPQRFRYLGFVPPFHYVLSQSFSGRRESLSLFLFFVPGIPLICFLLRL